MVVTLDEVRRNMNDGVYDYTKYGECVGCGQCCTSLLPVSHKELKEIKRYVKKHNIKPCDHTTGVPLMKKPDFDLTCPFRDNNERKCTIYKIRPQICRSFKCDKPKKQIEIDKALISEQRILIDLWSLFKGK